MVTGNSSMMIMIRK